MVTSLLGKGANPHLRDKDGLNALAYSCCGDVGILSLLLESNVDVNSMSNSGETTLMAACSFCRPELVCVLLSRGANIDIVNGDNCTALDISSHFFHHEIKQLLEEHLRTIRDKFGRTKLMLTIIADNFELFSTLLTDWANVNETDLDGLTSLMFACSRDRPIMVAALLEKGANPNIRDGASWTALAHSHRADSSILSRLLELNVDVNSTSNCGTTLAASCYASKYEAVRILLSHGANINILDVHGFTALDIALRFSNHGIVQLLVDHLHNLGAKQSVLSTYF
ncbi:MAG: hypothetical protein A6F71_08460 [Cycloclasticus sp. symbiont of Poecilosclerida sp. M]|nr:MAG: hypothetical protein A6F71_08460 [Cycloclasticus sp. symbiont of Poecilosclerida sp. M]